MDLDSFSPSSDDVDGFHKHKLEVLSARKKTRKPKYDLPRHAVGDRFIRGPIPLDWLRAADSCGRSGLTIAILLWFAAGIQRSNPCRLTRAILAELGTTPKTARLVLGRMQSIGIISIDSRRGRSPLVTIRDLPQQVPTDS